MVRSKATAGFVAYPKSQKRIPHTTSSSLLSSKPWTQSASAQKSCPLFTVISAEIRLMIYVYALSVRDSQYFVKLQPEAKHVSDASQESISSQQYIFRPPTGKRGCEQVHGLSLLQTCQAVYTEARRFAVSKNIHVLLYPPIRALTFPVPTVATTYFSRIPSYLIDSVHHIHLFVGADRFRTFYDAVKNRGGYRSETPFAELGLMRNGNGNAGHTIRVPSRAIDPTTLTITIRDYEWARSPGQQNTDDPFMLADRFLRNRKWEAVFGSLQQLIIELEAEVSLMDRLEEQVRRLVAFEFDVGANRRLISNQSYDKCYWLRSLTSQEREAIRAREERLREAGIGDLSQATSDGASRRLVLFIMKWDLVIDEV